ncbi:MAG TPA: hypothetical protein VFA26_00255, partial [Gemmataceae bacterium]|nr:hypothetical protein [Gemmataceae bacterium]
MSRFGSGRFPLPLPSFPRPAWERGVRGAAAILSLLLLSAAAVARQPDAPAFDFPPRDRPEFFDEDESPVGLFSTPTVSAAPREVQVEDPVTYTVRVAAAGPVKRPPRRPKLDAFPGFAEQFYIEPVGDDAGRKVDPQTWEFVYRLKPKGTGVTAIPSFPFVCFTPGLLPPERGYQTKRTAEIPLTVRPRQKAAVAEGPPPITLPSPPPAVLELAPGPAVLRRGPPLPSPALLAVAAAVLLLPPVVCAGWYFAWRRLYPDAARLARRRRSQAAEEALRTLRTLRKKPPADLAAAAAEAVAGY